MENNFKFQEISLGIATISICIAILMVFIFVGSILWMVFTDADLGKLTAISGTLGLLFTFIFGVFGVIGSI